ncbi:hypothetical protein [Actinokineospora iranica]|uniref:Serine/threonine-protein kinase RsbW n=1 Tax=Actinokineospora iranica TaxID=1271860 RepID=A0A1G6RUT5_9PSEU|nr:hypothetical protein [Actinokineospora iranica]SDD08318.1 serine/threonine-protein kinase RsbW [Actinokineospora iranica]
MPDRMSDEGELVELRVDAALTQLPLARAVAANIAMRRDYDVDSIADLQLVVDETCTMLISRALPFSELVLRFRTTPHGIDIHCTVPVLDDTPLDKGSLGWSLLTALVESMRTEVSGGESFARLAIELRMARRSAAA